MDERRSNDELDTPEPERTIVVRRRPFTRIATIIAVGILVMFVIVVATVWFRRVPIATHYLKREFERRGVTATYHLDRVGLRTQEVSNLVIGDPKHPDLVARYARIETRLKWNGNFSVYRIVARGVRLRGRLVHGKISWGQIDKLLPPPSEQAVRAPRLRAQCGRQQHFARDAVRTARASLSKGNGKLSGGFDGRVAVVSPAVTLGRCGGTDLHTYLGVSVRARRPTVKGPVSLGSFACPSSHFQVAAPRFDANATFNEAFTRVDGNGRMAIATLVAGENGLGELPRRHHLSRLAPGGGRRGEAVGPEVAAGHHHRRSNPASGALPPRHEGRHVQPRGQLCRRQRRACSKHAGGRDPAARGRGQDAARAGGAEHRQRAAADGPELQFGRAHQGRELPRRRRGTDRRCRRDRADGRTGACRGRKRRDLLLAGGRAQDRQRHKHGGRRPAPGASDPPAAGAPRRR